MAYEIKIPRLGWTMEEGVFVEWLREDGESIQAGESLFTLEGDKVTEEIEAIESGMLRIPEGAPKPGDAVAVGSVIGFIVADGEKAPALEIDQAKPTSGIASNVPRGLAPRVQIGRDNAAPGVPTISPRAARRALELGVDYRTVVGTGRAGRIRERDVIAAAAERAADAFGAAPTVETPASSPRRLIAERMAKSSRNTAAVSISSTADVSGLVALREARLASEGESEVPTLNDWILSVVAVNLRIHADVNAWWLEGSPSPRSSVNVGLAVDADGKLLVPVVRGADRLSVDAIATRTRQLIARARSGASRSEDLAEGTFTVTNLGMFGVDTFTPIINEPQVAILGVGRIRGRVELESEQLVSRSELSLSLTFDHRALDGAPAARFLQDVCKSLEAIRGS